MTEAKHVYELYIRTTPDQLWEAIVSSEFTTRYFSGTVESDWTVGSKFQFTHTDGWKMHYGTNLEVDPPRRLVQTFESEYSEEYGGGPDDISQVTWEIEVVGETCKLTLVHEYRNGESQGYRSAGTGWPMILSGLKTLLETGEELKFQPASEAAKRIIAG
jgi:uncharacterized protein YndB with AHSA1/START domain